VNARSIGIFSAAQQACLAVAGLSAVFEHGDGRVRRARDDRGIRICDRHQSRWREPYRRCGLRVRVRAAWCRYELCIAPLKSATRLYLRAGGVEWLSGGTLVEVICYYTGSGATDGYWDHIDWDSQNGVEVGHINDSQVNFDGQFRPASASSIVEPLLHAIISGPATDPCPVSTPPAIACASWPCDRVGRTRGGHGSWV
jgi:hypothetical protein